MNIGKQLKFYREQMELSQKELAELIFVSDRSVGHYETGVRIPPVDKLELMANVLQVDISDLLEPTKKTASDWTKFMVHQPNREKRKHMDSKQFKLFLKRVKCDKNVNETKNWITSEDICYHKQLGDLLKTISTKYIIFTASITTIETEKQKFWYIFGYIGNNRFSIELIEEDNDVLVYSNAPFYEYTYLSLEFKGIINSIMKWFQQTFPLFTFKYDVETLIYLDNMDKEYILNLELENFNFFRSFKIFNQFKYIKQHGLNTLKKIIQAKKENHPSLEIFFMYTDEILRKVESWKNDTDFYSVALLPTPSELKALYSDSREIPLRLLDGDNDVFSPFIHRGNKTLGEIAEFTKEDVLIIYGMYNIYNENNLFNVNKIDRIDQLEQLFSFHNLTFREEN